MTAPPTLDFLVAGVQKGGTTALADYLRAHPAIGLPDAKELHVFDDEALDWRAPDLSRLTAALADIATRPVRGEATPIYVYWPRSLERIARYRPGMRLILLFRDPVARAWSHWRMEHARGFDDAPFGWAIREGRRRVAEAPDGAHRVFSYVERGFYAEQLRRLDALFPRDQVLLLRSEDLDADPSGTLARVHRFLGVAPQPPAAALRSNVGEPARIEPADADHLRALYAEDTVAFGRASGLDVSGWLGG